MRCRRFLAVSILATFVGLTACTSEPDTAPVNKLFDGGACVIATRVPAEMRSLPRTVGGCGQTLVGNGGRHVMLSARSLALAGTRGDTASVGGRTVRRYEMVGGSPAGGTQIEFEESGVSIQANIWGLSADEVEELVAGLEVVSRHEWEERTR